MKLFLYLFVILNTAFAQSTSECENLFNWIYKDITLNNMQETVEILKAKTMLAVITSLKNSKNKKLSQNTELVKHYKTLSENSELFLDMTNSYAPLENYKFWRPFSYYFTDTLSFKGAFKSWKELQKSDPNLFKGLEKKYLINEWDTRIVDKLSKLHSFSNVDRKLGSQLGSLLRKIRSKKAYDISTKDISSLESKIKSAQKNIYNNIKDNYSKYIKSFSSLCDNDSDLLGVHLNLCRRIVDSPLNIENKLNQFSAIFNSLNIENAKRPKKINRAPKKNALADLKINKIDYKTNPNKNATYCIRDKKALSAITIHHTGTDAEKTPKQINQFHLNRGTKSDPWYMVGYHYLVSSSNLNITQGRPLEYKGAHAGGHEAEPTKKEFNRIKNLKMTCAHDKKGHKKETPNSIVEDFKNKTDPHGNMTSVGIALIGNYEANYKSSVAGVRFINNSSKVIPRVSKEVIEKTAKLSCKLQKENPTIKVIRPHSYYKATNCPGSIIADLKDIAQKANEYGCTFKVEFVK